MNDQPVITVQRLTRRFGAKTALDGITVDVPRGCVFGLVGANGAGKTTLIKHVLGLFRAAQGSVRVFGRDPVADPVGVLSRIGYLSEENDLPGWMRVAELLRYMHAEHQDILDDIRDKKQISDETGKKLKDAVDKFAKAFA